MTAAAETPDAARIATGAAGRFTLAPPQTVDAGAWVGLAGRAAFPNPFFAPPLALAAAHALGNRVEIAMVDEDGVPVALAPVVADRPGRVRFWTHAYAPLGTPLVAPEGAAGALAVLLAGAAKGRAVVVPDVIGDEAAALLRSAAGGARTIILAEATRAGAYRATWKGFDGLPRHRRKDLRRRRRRLAEQGALTWHTATSPDEVRGRFEAFAELEASGWKGRRGSALAAHAETLAFAREAVVASAETGNVRIDSLELDGRPAATGVSFVAGDTLFTWKMGFREELAACSPGVLMMLELPDRVFAETQIATIDSCADPDNVTINRLWPERLPVRSLAIGNGLPLAVTVAAARAEALARTAWRRLKARKIA